MTEYAKLVVAVDSTQAKQTIDVLIRLEDAGRKVDDTNKKMERSSRSLAGTLTRLAAPLAAFLSVRAVIRASDEYGQMASRIRNATESTEEYEMVQARLLETANGTYRALSEAQEVYLATSDTLRDLGYTTSEVLDITDSFSYALVRDAARVDQATSAMDAYSKSLMKGKIDADAWATIMAATPSLVEGISEATGRATSEIRQLGASGKLSIEALNEGLRISREENKRFADAMETSVEDALINLQTQFSVFVGKVNESSEASGVLVQSLEEMAAILADPATIEAAQQLAGGVVQAFNSIATVVRETVGVVRWGAESLAAALHGPAADDIVRLQDQLETYQEMLANPLKRLRLGADGQAVKLFSEEEVRANIAAVQSQIDAFWENASKGPPLIAPEVAEEAERQVQRLVSAVATGGGEVDRLAKRLSASYDSALASLQRQIALFGDTTEAARVRYELESGSLQGIVGQQREYLIGLAEELDMKNQLKEAEESGDEYRRVMTEISIGSMENPEIARLNEMYFKRKEIIDEALRTEYLTQEQHNAAMVLLDQQTAAAREQVLRDYQLAQEQAAIQTMGSIVSITQTQIQQMQSLVDEGGAIGKAFFVMTQGLAAANSIIHGFQSAMAIRVAYAQMAAMSGPAAPAVLAAGETHAGIAQAMGFATAGMIAAQTIQSFDGGGYTGNGPRVGGLDGKGGFMAMVHPRETIIDHTKQRPGRAGGPPEVNFTAQVVIEAQAGMSPEETRAQGEMAAGAMRATFMSMIEKESRPGGLLWSLYGGGR